MSTYVNVNVTVMPRWMWCSGRLAPQPLLCFVAGGKVFDSEALLRRGFSLQGQRMTICGIYWRWGWRACPGKYQMCKMAMHSNARSLCSLWLCRVNFFFLVEWYNAFHRDSADAIILQIIVHSMIFSVAHPRQPLIQTWNIFLYWNYCFWRHLLVLVQRRDVQWQRNCSEQRQLSWRRSGRVVSGPLPFPHAAHTL